MNADGRPMDATAPDRPSPAVQGWRPSGGGRGPDPDGPAGCDGQVRAQVPRPHSHPTTVAGRVSVAIAIDLAPVPDFEDQHDQLLVPDPVDDPIFADSVSVEVLLAFEFDGVSRSRVDGQLFDASADPASDLSRQLRELSAGLRCDKDAVFAG